MEEVIPIQLSTNSLGTEQSTVFPLQSRFKRTSDIVNIDGVGEVLTYGVSLTGVDRMGKRTTVSVKDISTNKSDVDVFIKRLTFNNASPIHLQELAEDYVAELSYAGLCV